MTLFYNSFSAGRDYECQILLCSIFVFRHRNNSILIDLRARNFVHAKTSLRARSSPCAQFVEPWAHSITLLSRCPTHSFQKQKQLKRKNEFPSLLYFPAQMSVLINQSPRLSFKVFPTLNSKQLWNTSSMVYKRNFFLAKFTIAMIT